MKKAFWIIFSIILVAGLGFGGWYFFLRVPYFKVEFYGDIEIVAYLSGDGKYKEGEEVSLYAQEKQGYTFDCWIKDDQVVSTDKKYTFIMTKDTAGKYSARYTALEYNINTPHNEHIEIESNANTGEIVSVNVTIVDGYEVDEMYYIVEGTSDKVVIKNNQFKMPGTNIQVFVTFKESAYTISYDLQGGTCGGLPTSYTINSQAINIPNPTKEGYMFDGWTDDNNNIPTKSYTIVQGSTGDIKLVAHWTKGSYSITKNVQGQGILNIQQNAVIGDTINFSTFAADGYYLKEVYYIVNGTEDKVVVEDSFAMPGDNITVCAIFEKTVYTITTHQEKCTIELSQDSACYGDELTINVIPNIGYQVESQYYVIQGQDQQIPLENTLSMPLGNIEIFVVVSAI